MRKADSVAFHDQQSGGLGDVEITIDPNAVPERLRKNVHARLRKKRDGEKCLPRFVRHSAQTTLHQPLERRGHAQGLSGVRLVIQSSQLTRELQRVQRVPAGRLVQPQERRA